MDDYYNDSSDDFNVTDDNSSTADYLFEICNPDWRQENITKIVQVVVFLVVLVLGVIGNVLVIATFLQYRRLRLRCMTDVFLFCLALSDLLLLLTLPLKISEILIEHWRFENSVCKLNHGMYAINTYGGLLLLACISIDRYMLVVWAAAAQALRPSMLLYSKLSALAVAVISIILSLPELLFASVNKDSRCEIFGKEGEAWVKMWARMAKIAGFCMPFMAMLVCYSAIGHVLMQGRGKCWRRQRTLHLIIALVVLFLLFQLPYALVLSIQLFQQIEICNLWIEIHLAEDITHSLAFVRCCLNPILYALVGVRFRSDVSKLLYNAGCRWRCLAQMASRPYSGSSITPSSPPPTYLRDAYTPTKISEDTPSISNQPQNFTF